MAKLATPTLTLSTLSSDFADIEWDAIPIPAECNADPDDSMTYSVWFDGSKQADRTAPHADFDDLTPGSTHTVQVQAVPRAGWDCTASETAAITFTTLAQRTGILTIITDPPEATVEIDGTNKGYTPIDIPILMNEYRKRVTFRISYELDGAFKEKTRHKTVRPGLVTRYLTRLSTKAKIKGTTKKDNTAKEVTFTMWVEDRKTHEKIPTAQLYLLNMTSMKRCGSLIMPGSYITISYSSNFFVSGKNKLVCYWGDTGDRIRAFRTITIPRELERSLSTSEQDEDWHDEEDDDIGEIRPLEQITIDRGEITRRIF